jgi:hypothetical protein
MSVSANPDENLTGGQIEQILNTLLYTVLQPIILRSNIFDSQIVYALSFISKNKKRKISIANSREDSIDFLAKALLTEDPYEKLELVKKAKLERSMIYVFAKNILDYHYDQFFKWYEKFLDVDAVDRQSCKRRIDVIRSTLQCDRRSDLYVMLNEAHDALEHYTAYVSDVVNQYVRLCSQQAKFFVKTNPNNQYDFFCVRQNFLRSVLVALNKYNSQQGALTSYIKFWILNAQTCSTSDHEYGIAFRVPPQLKKKMATDKESPFDINFSVSLDATVTDEEGEEVTLYNKIESSETVDDQLEHHKFATMISLLAKNVDPLGIGRLTLNIDEQFTASDLGRMESHMLKQQIPKL